MSAVDLVQCLADLLGISKSDLPAPMPWDQPLEDRIAQAADQGETDRLFVKAGL